MGKTSKTDPVHERYISQLFRHLRKDPPQGYMKTSIQQFLRADRAVWAKIIEDNVSVRRDVTGQRPLDTAVPASLHSPKIAFHLVPLPKPIHQPRMSGRSNSGARMMNGRTSNGTRGSHMILRKPKEKATGSGPTWCQKSSNTKTASLWIIMAGVCALDTT